MCLYWCKSKSRGPPADKSCHRLLKAPHRYRLRDDACWSEEECGRLRSWTLPFSGFLNQNLHYESQLKVCGQSTQKIETVVECMAHLFCKMTSEIPNMLSHLFPERMWLSTSRDTERWWTKIRFKCRINLLSAESLVEVVIKLESSPWCMEAEGSFFSIS